MVGGSGSIFTPVEEDHSLCKVPREDHDVWTKKPEVWQVVLRAQLERRDDAGALRRRDHTMRRKAQLGSSHLTCSTKDPLQTQDLSSCSLYPSNVYLGEIYFLTRN
ncbi:hypothetical protein AV530_002222 [Patagioenas fasciata monilis]|uniref:Uncharacterized protein n=1 Tax=Patagioenas fasciata monilis TaxID=372326 RepID=A0A1V4K5K0_PATFA|nr:hypothetical protein AV530_002222 [Patagioenas fasciata monilis]